MADSRSRSQLTGRPNTIPIVAQLLLRTKGFLDSIQAFACSSLLATIYLDLFAQLSAKEEALDFCPLLQDYGWSRPPPTLPAYLSETLTSFLTDGHSLPFLPIGAGGRIPVLPPSPRAAIEDSINSAVVHNTVNSVFFVAVELLQQPPPDLSVHQERYRLSAVVCEHSAGCYRLFVREDMGWLSIDTGTAEAVTTFPDRDICLLVYSHSQHKLENEEYILNIELFQHSEMCFDRSEQRFVSKAALLQYLRSLNTNSDIDSNEYYRTDRDSRLSPDPPRSNSFDRVVTLYQEFLPSLSCRDLLPAAIGVTPVQIRIRFRENPRITLSVLFHPQSDTTDVRLFCSTLIHQCLRKRPRDIYLFLDGKALMHQAVTDLNRTLEFSCDFHELPVSRLSGALYRRSYVLATLIGQKGAMNAKPESVLCNSITDLCDYGERKLGGFGRVLLYCTKPDQLTLEIIHPVGSLTKIHDCCDLKIQRQPISSCRLFIYEGSRSLSSSRKVFIFPLRSFICIDLDDSADRRRFKSDLEEFLGASVREAGVVTADGVALQTGTHWITGINDEKYAYAVIIGTN
jgi:hypothetical protein